MVEGKEVRGGRGGGVRRIRLSPDLSIPSQCGELVSHPG